MDSSPFTSEDRRQLEAHGLTMDQVAAQLKALEGPPPFQRLVRPCRIGDGIRQIGTGDMGSLVERHGRAALAGRCLKFVPASGSASRMFSFQLGLAAAGPWEDLSQIASAAQAGGEAAGELLRFFRHLQRFPFFPRLAEAAAEAGMDLDELQRRGDCRRILQLLLFDPRLDCARLPKGLVDFHGGPQGRRTAVEEHLVEAVDYVRDAQGVCRLHFTVSPEHRRRFADHLDEVQERYEATYGVRFRIDLSVQGPATDTLAGDPAGGPFRSDDGRLLLRPGGHGALLENLNHLQGDIVFIKNIDNVVPDRLKGPTVLWKKVLAGLLVDVQDRVFAFLDALTPGPASPSLIRDAMEWAATELAMSPPEAVQKGSREDKRAFLVSALQRPLRVCGVVRNQGEPGGGPFWVAGPRGRVSLQIVESVQVDLGDPAQRGIWEAATHFNPVDIVCGVRDRRGRAWNLQRFADPGAVLITRKTSGARQLKALEHPGLWNGGMAHWNTLFVEVPLVTFNPVKTVNDLLRDEHQE